MFLGMKLQTFWKGINLLSDTFVVLVQMSVITGLYAFLAPDQSGPRFVHEPPSLVEFDNNTGTVIQCSARGNPIPRITWNFQDGRQVRDVPGLRHFRSDGSIFFPSFRSEDYKQEVHDTTYRCIASNVVGAIRSKNVQVKGVIQRQFKVQVHDEFVSKGNVAVLRCHVPSFVRKYISVTHWEREDGVTITSSVLQGGRYGILPNGDLHIRDVTMKDGLTGYRCYVRHRLTSDITPSTDMGRLIINDPRGPLPPQVRDEYQRVHAEQGQNVELACIAQATPTPTYRWYKDKYLLSSTSRLIIMDNFLLIKQVEVTDSGEYFCVVNNSVGEKSLQKTLVVTGPLSVEVQPETLVADVGKSAVLNCTVVGYPVLNVQWVKDKHSIAENSRVRLMSREVLYITMVKREDRGMYQCFVYNNQESVQGTAELKIGEVAPSMVVTFPEKILKPGTVLSLSCSASGNPLPEITWILDGFPLPESSRLRKGDYVTSHGHVVSYVNISDIRIEDGGEYTCKATNAVESVTYSGKINVYGPPVIRPMGNITVLAGDTKALRCPVSGYPVKSISWERDGSPLPLTHRQKVEPNGTLILTKIERPADEGEYTCIAKSPEDLTARGRVYVTIRVAPLIDEEFFPEIKTVSQGMRVKLVCVIVRGDAPISIRWTKDGAPIVREHRVRVQNLEDSSLLILKNVTYSDSGNYTCVASNSAATVSRTTALVVNVPPQWVKEPSNTDVIRGNRISMDCVAGGYPKPRIIWKKSSGKNPGEFRNIGSSYRIRVYGNGSLFIHETEDNDSGYYMCHANNGIGGGLSKVVFLNVHAPPKFETKFGSQTVRKQEDASLNCDARGEVPLNVRWKKDRNVLDTNNKKYRVEEDTGEGVITSRLIISSTDRQDSALYTCIVSNQYGSDETNIQLVVQEPPSPPTNLVVSDVTSRTVQLSWKPSYNGNSAILKYVVEYKNVSGSWDSQDSHFVFSTPHTSVTVRSLHPVSSYHFRVLSENLIGRSEPSEIVECRTAEEVPGGPPLNVNVEATGSQSLKVTWMSPKLELQHGVIQGYYVGYKRTNSEEPFQYKSVEKASHDQYTSYLTNLKRNTKYAVLVQAFNNAGAGPMSDAVHAVTLEAAPPTSPVIAVTSTSSSTITIRWKVDTNDVTLKDYVLHYSHDGGDWKKESLKTNTGRYTLKGLKCGTRYHLFMTASNSLGTGEPRDPITARTKGGAPVSPQQETFIIPNTTFLTLNLGAWQSGGCPIRNFTIKYQTAFLRRWNTVTVPVAGLQKHLVISHLAPDREYNILVSAHSEAGTTEAEYDTKTLNLSLTTTSIATPPVPPLLKETYLPFYRNLTVLLPVVISVIVLLVVIVAVIVCLRRQTDTSSGASSGESQSRKCRQVDAVGMVDFYQKGRNDVDSSLKSSSYFSPPSGKTIKMTSSIPHRRRDDNHEYAEPYAAVPPPTCITDEGCPTMLSIATRTDGPYATIKRSPVTYLPPITQGIKTKSGRQMAPPERVIICSNSGSIHSGSSGDRPSSM